MSKILVTGGAGFIGSHLVEALIAKGHEVIVLDNLSNGNKLPPSIRNKIKLVIDDVRNRDVVLNCAEGCEQIFHFAAILGVDIVADRPSDTMIVESMGMQNVVHAALKHGVKKIIYASTSGIYGHSAIDETMNEEVHVDPRTSYAIAKRFNEIFLKTQHEENELESVSIRFFNVYGPRQDARMVISKFFEQGIKNNSITIYGTGNQTRDFTYIDDAIKATILLSEKVKGCEIVNIANEKELTIKELALKIKELTKSSSELVFLEVTKKRYDYEIERRLGCSKKLLALTGYKPGTNVDKGLKETYEFFKKT